MANTRSSAKRAKQAVKKNKRNQVARTKAKTALKSAIQAIESKNLEKAKEAFLNAVRSLSKAGTKGVIPKKRAARKVSRLALFAKKTLPELLNR